MVGENGTTLNTRAAVYNGNDTVPSWGFLDGGGTNGLNKHPAFIAYNPNFAVLNGKLYLTWREDPDGSTQYQVRATVYNGNDGSPVFTFVDGNSATVGLNYNPAQFAGNVTPAIVGGKLYLMWHEQNGTARQIRAKVYNGNDSAPVWVFVDGNASASIINKDTTKDAYFGGSISFNGKLYGFWQETNGTANQVRVSVYNGNDVSPSWALVDGGGTTGINKDPTKNAAIPSAGFVFNGTIFLGWYEPAAGVNQARMVDGQVTSSLRRLFDGAPWQASPALR